MSTPEPPLGGQQHPNPPFQPDAPTQAYPPAATGTLPPQQPGQPFAKKAAGLAIAALVVGIVAFLTGLVPILGAIIGAAAVVLGIIALRRHQSKGMSIAGTALGGIAVISSIVVTAGLGAAVSSLPEAAPIAPVTESVAPSEPATEEAPAVPEPIAEEPVAEAPAAEAAPEEPAVPAEFATALIKAGMYSETAHMSKAGLYDQLTSEYGEKYSPEAAQYAVDTLQADYNANALEKAKTYRDTMAMSPEAIRDQLISEYGEQFTPEEAEYAIANLNS
jgi:hypothetical protein